MAHRTRLCPRKRRPRHRVGHDVKRDVASHNVACMPDQLSLHVVKEIKINCVVRPG